MAPHNKPSDRSRPVENVSAPAKVGLWIIRVYRRISNLINFEPICLFRESCSHHVERVLVEEGLLRGVRAFFGRMAACRSGYSFEEHGEDWIIVLRNGAWVRSNDVSPRIRAEAERALRGSQAN